MLKDRIVLLSSTDAVEAFLERFPTSVIFKAGTCHKTMQGFGFVQEELEPREDLMCGVIRVVEARPMNSRPDVGLVRSHTEMFNQHGEQVLLMDSWGMFRRRNPGAVAEQTQAGYRLGN